MIRALLLFALVCLVAAALIGHQDPAPEPAKPLTAAEAAAKAKKQAAFDRIVRAGAVVKRSMRNPDSLVWEDIRANDDASLICFEYRAQNGFGGMNRERVVIRGNTPSQDPRAWNASCVQALPDFGYADRAIDQLYRLAQR